MLGEERCEQPPFTFICTLFIFIVTHLTAIVFCQNVPGSTVNDEEEEEFEGFGNETNVVENDQTLLTDDEPSIEVCEIIYLLLDVFEYYEMSYYYLRNVFFSNNA